MPGTVEILTIGDELLRGDLIDTNAGLLAARLGELGLEVRRIASVGDALEAIVPELRAISARADALLVSGGLGPTEDDRTSAAVAAAAGVELVRHEHVVETIRARFAAAGLEFTANNESQACFPAGAAILENDRGTAPGFTLQLGRCRVYCMPGVPRELERMFERQVAPALERELGARAPELRRIKVFGLAEAKVDHLLAGLLDTEDVGDAEVSLHYRATFPEIHVTLVVRGSEEARARALADRLAAAARVRLGRNVFATDDKTFSQALVQTLRQAGATLALAESCTGGLAGDLITRASGSSDVFLLDVVAYDNAIKRRVLGVPEELLERHGAVSRQCVEAMAQGVRALSGASYAVAISGIAGPTGGTDDKPVGTVHFALVGPNGTRHLHRRFPYGRRRIKQVAAHVALWLVRSAALGDGDDLLFGRWAAERAQEDSA